MNLDKKRTFIVNTLYFGIMLLLAVVLLKYALPLLAPFVIGFVLAYLLKRPIRWCWYFTAPLGCYWRCWGSRRFPLPETSCVGCPAFTPRGWSLCS